MSERGACGEGQRGGRKGRLVLNHAPFSVAFVHLVVVYLADSSALSVDAMTFGRFLNRLVKSKDVERARKYAMMGIGKCNYTSHNYVYNCVLCVAMSVICRGFSATSGMMLFSDSQLQCTGTYAQNYTDGDANTLSMLTNNSVLVYDADAVRDVNPLRTFVTAVTDSVSCRFARGSVLLKLTTGSIFC